MDATGLRLGNYVDLFGSIATVEHADFLVGIAITKGKPITLTEELLLKFGFEKWDNVVVNEFEYFERFVLYNVVGGTSNFEVHIIHFSYGKSINKEIIYSIDLDERMNFIEDTDFVHTLQNTFALTGKELTIK
jgi:hypothetical protein